MPTCSKCKISKPHSDFFRNRSTKSGLTAYCKACSSMASRQWERENSVNRMWYSRKAKYGVSEADFWAMLENQSGLCAICVKPLTPFTGHIDHDHKTGLVRGILCGSCNRAIGLFKDNEFVLTEAAAYLENFREQYQGELVVPRETSEVAQ